MFDLFLIICSKPENQKQPAGLAPSAALLYYSFPPAGAAESPSCRSAAGGKDETTEHLSFTAARPGESLFLYDCVCLICHPWTLIRPKLMNHYQLYGLETLVHILSLPRCIKGYLSLISLCNLTSQTYLPGREDKIYDVQNFRSRLSNKTFGRFWLSQWSSGWSPWNVWSFVEITVGRKGADFFYFLVSGKQIFPPQTIQISRMLSQRLKPEYGKTHQHFTR